MKDDKLAKFECYNCRKQFLVGKSKANKVICCPFCGKPEAAYIAYQADDQEVDIPNCLMLHK